MLTLPGISFLAFTYPLIAGVVGILAVSVLLYAILHGMVSEELGR